MSGDEERWHCVGPSARFRSGRPQTVKIADRALAVGYANGRFFAVDDACPHGGASLGAGRLRGGTLVCPLHQWEFDLASGACLRFGPPVTIHPVRVAQGMLEVRL